MNVHNTIFWGNAAGTAGDQGHIASRIYVDHSNVDGGASGITVIGSGCMEYEVTNIDLDPDFRNVAMHDYRISSTSPCIDAGNRQLLPCDEYDLNQNGVTCASQGGTDEEIPYDRRFLARVSNVTIDEVDMGAYEFQFCGPADLNADGAVNVLDLLLLLSAWGSCADPNDCPEDFNDDGEVNVLDMLTMLGSWGDCEGDDSGAVPSTVNDCLAEYAPGTIELERCLQLTIE